MTQPGANPFELLDGATRDAIRSLVASARKLDLQPGETLVRQGDQSDSAFFLDEGAVQVFAETAYGAAPLAILEAPRLIGEIGALAGLPRTASMTAATPVRLYEIGRVELLELGRQSPELLLKALEQLGRQLGAVNEALGLYSNALAALEQRKFDSRILEDLGNPPPALATFAAAFRRFATEIVRKRRREDEMASAALIQQSLLPKDAAINRRRSDVEIAARMRPAREVGGDFYDFFMLDDDRLAFAIGDVCGKGTPASLFASIVVTLLRTLGRDRQDVGEIVNRANALLCEENDAAMFATVFFGVLDLRTGALRYANCGHVPPAHVSSAGALTRLLSTGAALGIDASCVARMAEAQLEPGDRLILVTDGVTEAMNAAKEEFGESGFVQTVQAEPALAPAALMSRVFTAVDDFAQGEEQADDIGCLVIERK
ncbi:SpoIIE family protein phosphatase [Methylocystis echinoides]|uniref:PP2C family protein-serine/threonine phosphatase n=1 Tax=Methylocystis echinoides TaxID=29468 RepID=UPI00343CB467